MTHEHIPETFIKNLLLDKRVEKVLLAANKAAVGIDEYYKHMTQESRRQSIWEEDHSLWFHRDELMIALGELKTDDK